MWSPWNPFIGWSFVIYMCFGALVTIAYLIYKIYKIIKIECEY